MIPFPGFFFSRSIISMAFCFAARSPSSPGAAH